MPRTAFPEYCEQASLGYLLEPLNAISSLAFVVASYFLYRSFGSIREIRTLCVTLLIATGLVGLGSLSWHTTRHVVTFLFDVLAIDILFIFLSYHLAEIIFGRKHANVVVVTFVVVQTAFFVSPPQTVLNGSAPYFVGLIPFAALAVVLPKRMPSGAYGLSWSVAIFGVSIFLRSLDRTVCTWVPFGTHFLWHLGSALAIYFSVRTILRMKLASLCGEVRGTTLPAMPAFAQHADRYPTHRSIV